ncbi:MAG: hypothetical protein ACTSWY_12195 [Promethearchaeota archaeon]
MATPLSVFINLILNIIPILIVFIPIIFIRNQTIKKIYKRFFWGITIFFLIYFIMPIIFQVGQEEEMNIEGGGVDIGVGIGYFLGRTFSLIANYLQLPIINLSFVFIIAPFISVFFLWIKIRKEENKGFRENLVEVTFEIKKSPKEMIKDRLIRGDWTEEKQLFKLMIILLPISLYLLTTILKIAELPLAGITSASGLGWFIEIFFIYLASFLFGIHLLKASNVSYKGNFIGEKLESDTSSSLITVGGPISILSILLFIVEYSNQLTLILYFFGYFIMMAFIFISYLAVFEPICVIILVKIVDFIKNKQKIKKEESLQEFPNAHNIFSKEFLYPLGFGAIGGIFMYLFIQILGSISSGSIGGGNLEEIQNSAYFNLSQSFENAIKTEILQIIWTYGFIFMTIIIGVLLYFSNKNIKRLGISALLFSVVFFPIVLFFDFYSLLFGGETVQWVTGKLITTHIFSNEYFIFSLRTAFLDADLSSNYTLYILAAPYNYTRYLAAFIFWGVTFYYSRKKFLTKLIRKEKYVHQTTFSELDTIPSEEEFLNNIFLISSNPDCKVDEQEKEGAKVMLQEFKNDILTDNYRKDSIEENKRIYNQLKYLTKKKYLQWWIPEFSFTFEKAQMDSLYVMYSDGRDVISYRFSGESKADPALVAGMFSAITSFIKETTKSSDLLRTIDHGDAKITIEYGEFIFAAIFADMVTTEIRTKLKRYITAFEKKHNEVLKKWNGNTAPFKNKDVLVKEVFEV